MENNRSVTIMEAADGKKIAVIHKIRFKGKRAMDWDSVREYLMRYVGNAYEIAGTGEEIRVGKDFPNEYTGSEYTYRLKGAAVKAKANAAQGIPELLRIAFGEHYRPNSEEKHKRNAKFGWYRYDSYFALPVFTENGETERYNLYHASLIIRFSEDGKKYLYDMIDIKKETSNPLGS